ncbi:YopX family protein [uncultured Campylobacter sp.]|uniref:YopX family protein n=1 Tax=uncultured Campylobacter sp. TaxID=218934 RepID=UPI00262319A8|nr:YopX family protein [uncultured Campylobacter sp.]
MREIKFRALLKADGRIYEVLSVDFLNKEATLWDKETGVSFEADFDEIELIQYIGINDKNGVEIYEGYIIEFLENESGETWTAKIVFENLAFKALDVEDECYEYDFNDLTDIEVIGNIYENPELLKDIK